MNKKIVIFVVALIIIVIGWLVFKNFTTTTTTTKFYQGKITIGYTTWPGYLGLYIAKEKGYFKDAGFDVDVKGYTSLADQYADYTSGKVQGSAMLTLDVINQAYSGLDHKIVTAIDYSNGSDGIIASPNIKRVADVKGKKVAFEYGTLEEFFLRYMLDKNNLKFSDIVPINLNPEESAKAFVGGETDVAVTYEPFMSKALSQKEGKKIYSSADAPGFITDVLAFHTNFLNENRDTVEAIINAYFKAIQFWKDNPNEANIIIAKYLDTTADQVSPQVAGLIILNEKDNKTAFTFSSGLQSLYGNLRSIDEFVKAQKKDDVKKVDTDTLIEPRFIRKIVR